jgi:hypothetical protein
MTKLSTNQLFTSDCATKSTQGTLPKSESDNALYTVDNPIECHTEQPTKEKPSNSKHTNALYQSNSHKVLSTMISGMPALSAYVLPQNNPLSQLFLFNMFSDHPG